MASLLLLPLRAPLIAPPMAPLSCGASGGLGGGGTIGGGAAGAGEMDDGAAPGSAVPQLTQNRAGALLDVLQAGHTSAGGALSVTLMIDSTWRVCYE